MVDEGRAAIRTFAQEATQASIHKLPQSRKGRTILLDYDAPFHISIHGLQTMRFFNRSLERCYSFQPIRNTVLDQTFRSSMIHSNGEHKRAINARRLNFL
jgi:hypothetical protein